MDADNSAPATLLRRYSCRSLDNIRGTYPGKKAQGSIGPHGSRCRIYQASTSSYMFENRQESLGKSIAGGWCLSALHPLEARRGKDELRASRVLLHYADYMADTLDHLRTCEREMVKNNEFPSTECAVRFADNEWEEVLQELDDDEGLVNDIERRLLQTRIKTVGIAAGLQWDDALELIELYQHRKENDRQYAVLRRLLRADDPKELASVLLQDRLDLEAWLPPPRHKNMKQALLAGLDCFGMRHFANFIGASEGCTEMTAEKLQVSVALGEERKTMKLRWLNADEQRTEECLKAIRDTPRLIANSRIQDSDRDSQSVSRTRAGLNWLFGG